ncbi:MAG: hypothetical protein K0U38_07235 [Epsilonproteobacteria bacterium]|nr:hypothetical protein [Campylobacterota bacterium]
METNITHLFIIAIPIIIFLLYLISESLLIVSIIGSIVLILLALYIYHSRSRKETLNIIRSNQTLYFNLSDDQLFSIELEKEQSLHEVLVETIKKEKATIEDMVNYIDFINFKNDKLQKELNELIKKES